MNIVIEALKYAGKNPMFLTAFLALLLLFAFRRAVNTTKGLDLLHDLLSSKLTRQEFAKLINKITNVVALALILATLTIIVWLVITRANSSQSSLTIDPVEGKVPAIERVQILKSNDKRSYPFELVLINPTDRNLLITEVIVSGYYKGEIECAANYEYIAMEVDFNYEVFKERSPSGRQLYGFKATGGGRRSGEMVGEYPIIGRMYDYCSGNNIGLNIKMPINVILEPNSRKILNLVLREGNYNVPRIDYGGNFSVTVRALYRELQEKWFEMNSGSKIIPDHDKKYLWDLAISFFLEAELKEVNPVPAYSQKLSMWDKIRLWNFSLIVGQGEAILRGEADGEIQNDRSSSETDY